MDALFGELHEMLWFNGTVVHPQTSEDAGIHRLWSRVLMRQIPAHRFLYAVRRAKEGSELTVRAVTVRPDSTGSQAARSFPHGTGEDPEALGGE